jgi:Calx-beta domain-containing protein
MFRLLFRFLLVVLAFVSVSAAIPRTFLTLNSQPGDYIGQGQQYSFTPADGTFTIIPTYANGIEMVFRSFDGTQFWELMVGPGGTQKLLHSVYEGATEYEFQSQPMPWIEFFGDGRGCDRDRGRFLISDLSFTATGDVARFAADFEQHCEGAAPALYGSLRYQSSVTAIPRVSVGNATVLKGNAGSNTGRVILSLSMPSTQPVTVQYTTADSAAVQGTDYLSSSGSVEFQPGETWQAIAIPILGNLIARGNRAFYVKLSAPVGAPLGDSSGTVKILDPNVAISALAIYSQPGDYIGQGQLYLYTIANAAFVPLVNPDHGVTVMIPSSASWTTDFAAPNNVTLTAGSYPNAQRYPFQAPDAPGLNVDGAGRGCNTLFGSFVVHKASYSTSNAVLRFSADLEQHCAGMTPALFGWIRIASPLQQISVTDAVIDSTDGVAVFTVTLHPASTINVSANFSTADGTAVAGVDYSATSQTVTFAPGITVSTVVISLLNNSDGGKVFYGQLSTPSGAPIWINQGAATF